MKINPISIANAETCSRKSHVSKQQHSTTSSIPFKGTSDRIAEFIVEGSTLAVAGLLHVVSKILPFGNDDEDSEKPKRDTFDENLDVYGMGDATR